MRLLVTGACGFVGSCLVRGLVEVLPGLEVTGLDSFIREGSRGNVAPLQRLGVRIVEGDVRNEADLESAGPADWVIDCAAEPSVLAGVTGPTSSFGVMDHNLVGTIRTLEFCRRHQAGLVLLSTSRVYSITVLAQLPLEIHAGRFRPMPHGLEGIRGLGPHGIAEDFSTDPPLSLYGVSKRCAELVAQEYADAFGFPLWINRCGVLAGAGQFGKADQGIFSYWIRAWREGRPLAYIGFDGSGHQVRDCLHPRDLVPVLARQVSATSSPGTVAGAADGDSRIHNFAGGIGNSCSLAELSAWCRDRFGARTVASRAEPRPYDLPWVVLDATRARARWDWLPTTTLAEIFTEIADS
ncbi:MAG: NAD-dependent epimerase/dehydratase family protein [Planctomycetia bacterium]|jgi:CDP-paratose 2-epimerase